MANQDDVKVKKAFYKKWWFITVIVLFILAAIGAAMDEDEEVQKVKNVESVDQTEADEEPAEIVTEDEDKTDLEFEEVTEDVVEEPEVTREDEIRDAVEAIIKEDLNSTNIKEVKVNLHMGRDDGTYLVLPHLKWNVKNRAKTTREMLQMYSDNIAAKLADEEDVSEITIFWEVPYHQEGDNVAKYEYTRAGNNMSKGTVWLAPKIRD